MKTFTYYYIFYRNNNTPNFRPRITFSDTGEPLPMRTIGLTDGKYTLGFLSACGDLPRGEYKIYI